MNMYKTSTNIQIKNKSNEIYHRVCLFMMFFGRMDGGLYESDIMFMALIAMAALGIFLLIFSKPLVKYRLSYVSWQITFLAICIMSYFWSYDKGVTVTHIIALIGRLILLTYIWLYLTRTGNIRLLMKMFIASTVLAMFHIFVQYGFTAVALARMDNVNISSGWNANTIGFNSVYSVFFAYLVRKDEKNYAKRFLLYIAIVLCLIMMLMTGSKKALFIILSTFSIYLFLLKRNKITTLLLIVVGAFSVYYLIMNVEGLYLIIGHRIESLINGLISNDIQSFNTSDRTRMRLIEAGWGYFKEKPILGYGLANFKALMNSTLYSHNNYIEILVSVGLVGAFIYYYAYYFIFVKGIKMHVTFEGKIALALIIPLVIAEYALVSYLVFQIQFVIIIAMFLVQDVKRHRVLD